MAFRNDALREARTRSPWRVAWIILAPLAAWLALAKTIKVAYTAAVWLGTGPGRLTPVSLAQWLAGFGWSRLAAAAAVGAAIGWLCARRLKRLPSAVLGLGATAAALLGLAALKARSDAARSAADVAYGWLLTSAAEVNILVSALWREAAMIAALALLIGALLHARAPRRRAAVASGAGALVVLLSFATSVDLVYLLATGQPLTASVIVFTLRNTGDLQPLIAAETTPGRLLLLALPALAAVAWAVAHRRLPDSIDNAAPWHALVPAAIGAAALCLPVLPAGSIPYERYSEGSLIAFVRSAIASPSLEAERRVYAEFEASGRPRWHSYGMHFTPTPATQRRNVVIVMFESMRAASTTMHRPGLETTPYLAELAQRGLMVEDMNAVVPRTAGAWLAVLGGQYPLTNEATKTWGDANTRSPRIRGLPSALRDQGYATGFFTPTHLGLLNEVQVVKALGFDHIVSEPDLAGPEEERVNYMGLADEFMVDPLIAWAEARKAAGKPFLAAIMTNVGHHSYETPRHWKKLRFPGAGDPVLQDYLNCMRYVDGVLQTMVKRFELAGLAKDTVFVLLGDHGAFFGEHGVKQVFNALYQEGVQVPAVIYAPGLIDGPRVVKGPRQQVDILPTVAELLGYRIDDASLPGVSLLAPPDPGRTLYFSGSIEASFLAMRRGHRKFSYDYGRSPLVAFDLASDPGESRPIPVHDDAQADDIVREMLEWRAAAKLSMMARPRSAAAVSEPWLRE